MNYRDIENYKTTIIDVLNARGHLATEVALFGTSWVALVRGTGWCPVNNLLNNRSTRVPVDNDNYTSTL